MSYEQEARDMLDRMGVADAQSFTAGDVVELANLLNEIDRLRAELAEAVEREREACAKVCDAAIFSGNTFPRTQLEQLRIDIAAAIRARSALQSPRT